MRYEGRSVSQRRSDTLPAACSCAAAAPCCCISHYMPFLSAAIALAVQLLVS